MNARAFQIGQCGDQKRRVVQRRGSPQLHSLIGGKLFESDVDIIEHFDVIADKANGLNHHSFVTLALQRRDFVFYCWTNPWPARHPLTLEGEAPSSLGDSEL